MSQQTKNHTHKFKRIKYKSGNEVFFCVLNCNKKLSVAMALGKETICWICGEPFLLDEYSIRLVKPHCKKCHKPKKSKFDEIVDIAIAANTLAFGRLSDDEKQTTTADDLQKRLTQVTEEEDEI